MSTGVEATGWPRPDTEPEFRRCAERGLYCWRGLTPVATGEVADRGILHTYPVRRPRSMPVELSRVCDEWFERRFGWRARSNHSLFVSGSRDLAAQFGRPVIVLPHAPARYVWSPRIADLARHLKEMSTLQAEAVCAVLEAGDYLEADLVGAIASGHEIMVRCERASWSSRQEV